MSIYSGSAETAVLFVVAYCWTRKGRQTKQLVIKSKQMEVTPRLRQRIERKVRRLARLVDDQTRIEVTVTEEQTRSMHDRYSVHLALAGNTHPIRSEVSAVNASKALDLALDKVEAQLGRQKDRQINSRRHLISESEMMVLSLSRSGDIAPVDE